MTFFADLLVYVLACFGVSWVIADSKISFPFRVWLEKKAEPRTFLAAGAAFLLAFAECVACTGFHLGWVAYLFHIGPFNSWYIAAFFTCASNLLFAKHLGMLDS